jgi:hypothetical protein
MTQLLHDKDSARKQLSTEKSVQSAEAEILKAIRSIRYGSVEITIHDSRVVQIEYKKKIRVPAG